MKRFGSGPQAMDREDRRRVAGDIAEQARRIHGSDVLSILAYGSMARGTDGPYSDVEMMCILREPGTDHTHEWSCGPWKAELNVLSRETAIMQAMEVEGTWPLTHGQYTGTLAIYDPWDFRRELGAVVESTPDSAFDRAIKGVILGDIYEDIGKLRNTPHLGTSPYIPRLAMDLAFYGAMLVGLKARRIFTTGSMVLHEALELEDLPQGFASLCNPVISGDLGDWAGLSELCEAFWLGVESWAEDHSISLYGPGFLS